MPVRSRRIGHFLVEHQSQLGRLDGLERRTGDDLAAPTSRPNRSSGVWLRVKGRYERATAS